MPFGAGFNRAKHPKGRWRLLAPDPFFTRVDIMLDGKPRGQFDLYSARATFDVTGFRDEDLKEGFHTLRVIATGRKNEDSVGTAMTFNAANITNSRSSMNR